MSAYLVTYVLKGPNYDYSTFYGLMRSYPHIALSNSTVVVNSGVPIKDFFEGIQPYIDLHDQVFVFEISKTWTGMGAGETKKWLKDQV